MIFLWCTVSFMLGGVVGVTTIALCQAAGRADAAVEAAGKGDFMEKEIVQGYEIIKRETVGKKDFVIGYNPNAVSKYVTWKYDHKKDEYFWGHYMSTYSAALKDFNKRVKAEREYER